MPLEAALALPEGCRTLLLAIYLRPVAHMPAPFHRRNRKAHLVKEIDPWGEMGRVRIGPQSISLLNPKKDQP